MSRKRRYNSNARQIRAQETRQRILSAARRLFVSNGFEKTTIDKVALTSKVSAQTVYSLFKSKEGILRELINANVFGTPYRSLVEKARSLKDPEETLKVVATISRTVLDSETTEMGFVQDSSALFPELKKLEIELERGRFERQEFIVTRLNDQNLLPQGMGVTEAREILWLLTSREIYRKLVIERGWSSNRYEKWLNDILFRSLVRSEGTAKH